MEDTTRIHKLLLTSTLVVGVLLIIFALSSFQVNSEESKKQELYKSANEILITNSKVLSSTLHYQFESLEQVADQILELKQNQVALPGVNQIEKMITQDMPFEVMVVANQLGEAVFFSENGYAKGHLEDPSFFGKTYVVDKTVSGPFEYTGEGELKGKTVFYMVVPIMDGSKTIGSVGAVVDTEILRPVTYSQFLDGESYMFLFTDNGDIITRQISKYNVAPDCNNIIDLFESINQQTTDEQIPIDIEKIKAELKAKKGGVFTFEYPGGKETIIHQYTGLTQWHLGIVVPQGVINSEINRVVALGVNMSLIIGAGFLLIIAYVIINNIINHKENQRQYAQNLKTQGKYKIMSENAQKGMFEYDIKTGEFLYDQNFTFIIGKTPQEKYTYEEFIEIMDIYPQDLENMPFLVDSHLAKEEETSKINSAIVRIKGQEDTYRWHEISILWTKEISGYDYIIGSIEEIHDRVESENKLKRYAETDLLSGLYNKVTTENKIREYLNTQEGKEGTHAFIIIDCDDFKLVNDYMGHQEGDQLITYYGEKLNNIFRKEDIKGRIGGDEFVVFVKNVREQDIEARAKAILQNFDKTYQVEDKNLTISATIGICIYPEAKTFDQLYKNADKALYKAKKQGKGQYQKYQGE